VRGLQEVSYGNILQDRKISGSAEDQRISEHNTGCSLTVVMFPDFASAVSLLTGHSYYVSEVVNTDATNSVKFAIIHRYSTVGRTPLDE